MVMCWGYHIYTTTTTANTVSTVDCCCCVVVIIITVDGGIKGIPRDQTLTRRHPTETHSLFVLYVSIRWEFVAVVVETTTGRDFVGGKIFLVAKAF